MDVGIGLPNAVVGTTGAQLLDWARRADRAGFSTLATIGALSFPSHEELTVLGAAAAVTERIRLMTNVLIAPVRNTAELAKQAATVDQLSGGRLSLGLGVGWRAADYTVAGRDFTRRGSLFDQQLVALKKAWAGEVLEPDTRPVSPAPVQNPIPVVVGGYGPAGIRRAVQHGVGWTAGGLPPEATAPLAQAVRDGWNEAGREGLPRIVALAYFSLGEVEEESRRNMLDYYKPQGPEVASMIADGVLRSPDVLRVAIRGYEEAGVDELVLVASVSDPGQVDQLAEVAFG